MRASSLTEGSSAVLSLLRAWLSVFGTGILYWFTGQQTAAEADCQPCAGNTACEGQWNCQQQYDSHAGTCAVRAAGRNKQIRSTGQQLSKEQSADAAQQQADECGDSGQEWISRAGGCLRVYLRCLVPGDGSRLPRIPWCFRAFTAHGSATGPGGSCFH